MIYWVLQKQRWPKLFEVAEYVFSCDVHEIESERKFKVAKRVFSSLRSNLDTETGCNQAFLNDSLKKGNPFQNDKM